ncbi:hypothetical protein [Streptosporangium roseum]|uniref:hypothetical protein n=1 Tax=Streptosporangium roseum TaxID=2001 RepID=UPI0001A3EE13|nr:hypothetical protein [Streptosporangium roseum]
MLLLVLTASGVLSGMGATARADSGSDSTVANVVVDTSITLTAMTPSFTLRGIPGETVTEKSAVSMRVTTNNLAGYVVTVRPVSTELVGSIPGNDDVIPTSLLEVRGPEQGNGFTSLTPGAPVQVASSAVRAVPGGDIIDSDYRITIPPVRSDTYSGTLDYVATTL